MMNNQILGIDDTAENVAKSLLSKKQLRPFGRVYNEDCLSLLKELDSNSVQCIFADPPFNLGKKYSTYDDEIPLNDYLDWTREWIEESLRVLKPDGSFFVYNIPRLLTRIAPILDELAYFRHWISWNSPGKPLGKSLQPAHYGILYYTKREKDFKFYDVRAPHKKCRICDEYIKDYGGKSHLRHHFGYTLGDVWDDIHRNRHRGKRIENHPCQLPVHLIERIILMTTDSNDAFVDLFAGSGAGGVAAKQLNRDYLGADIDVEYTRLANEQISESAPVMHNDSYVSIHLGKVISIRDVDIKKESKNGGV